MAEPGAKDGGVVKFYDGARNYGICVGSSGRSAGKDVFIMGAALAHGFTPQTSDVLAFTLVVKVRSSGTEKFEAENISLVSRAEGNVGDNDTKSSTRSKISRRSNASQNSVQCSTKRKAKLSVAPKGQSTERAKQQQGKQKKKKPVKKNTPKSSKMLQKHGSKAKRDKAKQNRQHKGNCTDNSEKFAESKMFSSPEPSELPMPNMGIQRQHDGATDAKTFVISEKFSESALFCGSPDPKCLPMPRF